MPDAPPRLHHQALEGEALRVIGAVPLDSLRVRAFMDNAQLMLAPLDFGVAKHRLKTQVLMNSRAKPMQV